MLVASQQHEQLMAILSTDTKFEDALSKFTATFQKHEFLRVYWVLQYLLQHDVLLVLNF